MALRKKFFFYTGVIFLYRILRIVDQTRQGQETRQGEQLNVELSQAALLNHDALSRDKS